MSAAVGYKSAVVERGRVGLAYDMNDMQSREQEGTDSEAAAMPLRAASA